MRPDAARTLKMCLYDGIRTYANVYERIRNIPKTRTKTRTICPPHTPQGTTFELFWAAYPKKVGKKAALNAFRRVKTPLNVLLQAIEGQKHSVQWMKDNGKYIPNPATWLNQGRWEDELDGGGLGDYWDELSRR